MGERRSSVRLKRSQDQRVVPRAQAIEEEDKQVQNQEKAVRNMISLVARTKLSLSRRALLTGKATGEEEKKAPSQERIVRSMTKVTSILARKMILQRQAQTMTTPMASTGRVVPRWKMQNAVKETKVQRRMAVPSAATRSVRIAETVPNTEAEEAVQTALEEGAQSEERNTAAKTVSEVALKPAPSEEAQNVAEGMNEERIETRLTIVVVEAHRGEIVAACAIEKATIAIAGILVATTAEETTATEASETMPRIRVVAIVHHLAEQEPEVEIRAVAAGVAAVTQKRAMANGMRGLEVTVRLPDNGIDRVDD